MSLMYTSVTAKLFVYLFKKYIDYSGFILWSIFNLNSSSIFHVLSFLKASLKVLGVASNLSLLLTLSNDYNLIPAF